MLKHLLRGALAALALSLPARGARGRHEQGHPRRVSGGGNGLRSRRVERPLFRHDRAGDLRYALHVRLPRAAGEARAARRRIAAADHRQRQDVHDQAAARAFIRRRSGVRRQEARARGGGRRLLAQAARRSEVALAVGVPGRRQVRRAWTRKSRRPSSPASSTTTRNCPGWRWWTSTRCACASRTPTTTCPTCSPTSRRPSSPARSSRNTASPTAVRWRIRWAPARTGWRSGFAARRSCSKRIPSTADSPGTSRRRIPPTRS